MIAPLLLAAITASVPPKLDGITIGQNVEAVIERLDTYPSVENTDRGAIWTWGKPDGTIEQLTTDGDGTIQLIGILASPSNTNAVDVPGFWLLHFNEDGHVNADHGGAALFKDESLYLARRPGTVLGYAVAPSYGSIVGFAGPAGGPLADGPLIEVLTGTKTALFKTGLVPADNTVLVPDTIDRNVYKAAKLIQWPPNGRFVRNPPRYTYVRFSVGADGVAKSVQFFGGVSDLYAQSLTAFVRSARFQPATLNGKAVPSFYFRAILV